MRLTCTDLNSAADRLRSRIAAVHLTLTTGKLAALNEVADQSPVCVRTLQHQFHPVEAIYAFPPPELAQALAYCGAKGQSWLEVAQLVRPIFEALDVNKEGRHLLACLVLVHREHPELLPTDNFFAAELRIQGRKRGVPELFPLLTSPSTNWS